MSLSKPNRRLTRLLGVLAATVAFAPLVATGAPKGVSDREPSDQAARVLVQPRPGLPQARFKGILKRVGASEAGEIQGLDVHRLKVPPHARARVLRALSRNPHIAFAEPDQLVAPDETLANDPYFDDAWHLATINAPTAWDDSLGSGAVVAVADTGVDVDHADLSGKLLQGWNVVSNNTDVADIHGHGTKVAGVVGAASDNSLGVASLAWNTSILPIRITERSDGYAYWSDIAEAIQYAANNGADVVNVSYAATGSSTVRSAAQYLRSKGGIAVLAAGNSGSDEGYSDSPYIVTVAATTESDGHPSWSNHGDYVDVSAPGVGIWTTTNGGSFGAPSGTSFASPVTAGTLALMRSANSGLTPAELEDALERTAVDLGASGRDDYFGYGRVDAGAAVAEVASSTSTGDTQPPSVTIEAPSSGASVSGTVSVDVSASDDTAVAEVVLYADGTRVATDSATPWGFSWDSTTVADGDVTLLVEAYDEAGNYADASVAVTVSNSDTASNTAPSASDDSATTQEDSAVTIDVLANDSDADGDSLSVSSVTQPGNGSASLNGDGTVTYTPAAGFSGSDAFSYTVTDGAAEDTASVAVTVEADTSAAALSVGGLSPDTISAGNYTQTFTISGAGFESGATVAFSGGSGPAPRVQRVRQIDSTSLEVTARIKGGGPPRSRHWDVTVTNPDGRSARLDSALTVNP